MDRGNRTFICSVVFADIVEYSKKPVAEQIRLKDQFNGLISEAIKDVTVNDRIILDTGDGVAVSFLGAPEDALFVGLSLRDALKEISNPEELRARIGINLGPVRVVKDINGQPNIIGDGINVAQRVMSFAEPNEVLVSRSYYEVVSHLSQEYALLFSYQGARADKHVREHEVYAVGSPGKDIRPWSAPRGKTQEEGTAEAATNKVRVAAVESTGAKSKGWGRTLAYVGVPLAVIIALALVLRGGKQGPEATHQLPPASETIPKKSIPAAEAVTPASKAAPVEERFLPFGQPAPAPKLATSDKTNKPSPKREAPAAEGAPAGKGGLISLTIKPWGEVYVDGRKMGVTPPLKELQLTAGKHSIEIKNSTFPSYTETVEVKPSDKIKISHHFQ